MDDQQLLEAAAKAAGINWQDWTQMCGHPRYEVWPYDWNPLTEDGDAFRLAVSIGEPFVVRTRCVTTMGGLTENFDPAIEGDDLRAVRRIITRAAASLGERGKG